MTDVVAVARCAQAVVAQSSAPGAAAFLADWPELVATRAVAPVALPVLRWLSRAADNTPPGRLGGFAQLVVAAAHLLAWRQTYRTPDVDARFLDRYGWCEIFGLSGPIPSVALAGGFLLLGPETLYPSHGHVAEELYVPISGVAEWRRGTAPFVARAPGEVVMHASSEPHAMRTSDEPLLAFYLWRGTGLAEATTLGPDAAA